MALSLKDQFQIKTIPAYAAADGAKFHDLAEAQAHTRKQMIAATIRAACKDNSEFARLDKDLLTDFLLLTGRHVGAVMAEPLAAQPDIYAAAAQDALRNVTSVTVTGEISSEQADRMRRTAMVGSFGEKVTPAPAIRPTEAPAAGLRDRINDATRVSPDPLRAAMAAVDLGEMEAAIARDLGIK